MNTDDYWMQQALQLAKQAALQQEVPIGAVLVKDNQLITSAYNRTITDCDPTAHAEMIVLRESTKKIGNYRLLDTTLYVTLEPCIMCAGAIIQARIKKLVFATPDPRSGAVISVFNTLQHPQLNHSVDYVSDVCCQESREILQAFFQARRHK